MKGRSQSGHRVSEARRQKETDKEKEIEGKAALDAMPRWAALCDALRRSTLRRCILAQGSKGQGRRVSVAQHAKRKSPGPGLLTVHTNRDQAVAKRRGVQEAKKHQVKKPRSRNRSQGMVMLADALDPEKKGVGAAHGSCLGDYLAVGIGKSHGSIAQDHISHPPVPHRRGGSNIRWSWSSWASLRCRAIWPSPAWNRPLAFHRPSRTGITRTAIDALASVLPRPLMCLQEAMKKYDDTFAPFEPKQNEHMDVSKYFENQGFPILHVFRILRVCTEVLQPLPTLSISSL